jgi:hypothetical protein
MCLERLLSFFYCEQSPIIALHQCQKPDFLQIAKRNSAAWHEGAINLDFSLSYPVS